MNRILQLNSLINELGMSDFQKRTLEDIYMQHNEYIPKAVLDNFATREELQIKDIKSYLNTLHTNIGMREGVLPKSIPDDIQKLVDKYDDKELTIGMNIEQEHNKGKTDVVNSDLDVLKIVLAHLDEDPKYYTHLKAMEKKYSVSEATKPYAFLIDQLVNSMEHYESSTEFANKISKDTKIPPTKAKKIYDEYWKIPANKRFMMVDKDWEKWIKKVIK